MCRIKCLLGLFVLLLVLPPQVGASEKPWREIRSPHFRVITNGSEGAARQAARAFEQMRAVFASEFPGFRLDPPAAFLILAPLDEPTTKKLLPQYWRHSGPKPSGVYFHGAEKEYAVVRLDELGPDNPDAFAVVYHEYIHSLLHLNFRWLPAWLDEGLADFYGYTRFEKDHTYIGAPPRNRNSMAAMYQRSTIPLPELLDRRAAFSKDEDETHLFYAESWALVHFLTLSPNMDNGAKLVRFFNAIQHGADQKTAFQQTFGDFKKVQKDFDQYIYRFAFQAGVLPGMAGEDAKTYASRSLTLAETEAEMGGFYAATHNTEGALASSEAAVKEDPSLALPHETLGFIQLAKGNDDDARREFSRAVELDSKMYRSLFVKTMLSMPSAASASRAALRADLNQVLDGNPQYAPAYVELSKSYLAEGDLDHALAMARTAEKLRPSLAGYHLLSGQILLRQGKASEAAAFAAFVAKRWEGADHDEAMELWNNVPPDKRPADGPVDPLLPDVQRVDGVIKAVECQDRAITVTLDQEGKPQKYHFAGGSMGFSDTLWMGENFTPCHNTAGLRAAIRYKAATDKAYAGEAVSLGFRDDLPPSPLTSKSAEAKPEAR